MTGNLGALQLGAAKGASQLYHFAPVAPMACQRVFSLVLFVCAATPLKRARVEVSALLPVLFSLLVGELFLALVAFELCLVERLHGESVYLLSKLDLASAVGARVRLLLPLGNARVAGKLVALLAFSGLFDDVQADRACEVPIELCYGLFWRKLPVALSRRSVYLHNSPS